MKKNKTMVRALAFLIVIVMIVTTVMMSLTMVFGALSTKIKWLGNFTMAIVLILSMASSVLWVNLFA